MKEFTFSILLLFTSFWIFGQNESEPNNTFSQADNIDFGNTIQGFIGESYDYDYYKFNVTEPGIIKIEITNVPSDINLISRLYSPDLSLALSYTNINNGQLYTMEWSTCDLGFHYLYLRDGDNDYNDLEEYAFTITFYPFSQVDATECNNSFSEAHSLSSNETVDGLIAPWYGYDFPNTFIDEDYYSYNVTEPGIMKLRVTSVPADIALAARVYSPDQTLVLSKTNSNDGQGYLIELSTCELGEHYIFLRDTWNDFNSTDQYTFEFEFVPFSQVDTTECNNSFSEAYSLSSNEIIGGLIAPWYGYDFPNTFIDEDYYSYNVTEPGIMKLRVTSVPADIALAARVYSPDQTLVLSKTNSNDGQGYLIELSTCELGEHYIFLRDTWNDFNSTDQYTFEFEFVPFSQVDTTECNNSFSKAYPIDICDTISALIAPWFFESSLYDEEDYYSIHLEEGNEVNVDISSVPSSIRICVRIYDSSQSFIESFTGNTGQALNFNFVPPANGIYYFKITDCSNNFDSQNQYELAIGCNLINSANDFQIDKTVRLSPNPFNDHITIQSEHPIQNLQIFNAIGNQIFFHKGAGFNDIKTDDWQSGIYFILIETDAGVVVRRMIK